jgi:hypothetical protein
LTLNLHCLSVLGIPGYNWASIFVQNSSLVSPWIWNPSQPALTKMPIFFFHFSFFIFYCFSFFLILKENNNFFWGGPENWDITPIMNPGLKFTNLAWIILPFNWAYRLRFKTPYLVIKWILNTSQSRFFSNVPFFFPFFHGFLLFLSFPSLYFSLNSCFNCV